MERNAGALPGDGPNSPGPGDVAREIRRLLLEAYDATKRDLPWRGESDPYRVWVSEVMLQQTRVETVIPYYKEWVRRFPDVDALAVAEEEEVLRAWQGLGYYSRARNLHSAAKVVRERLGGHLPTTARDLLGLPGVGVYTAGAVASIAFGEVVPAVDGNVRRVFARLFDLPDPTATRLKELAESLVDPRRPGDFNQALMELGALVCTPRSPACGSCPLSEHCLALARGTVEQRPERKAKARLREVHLVTLVVAVGEGESLELLVRKRPPEGLLAGLWEFPGTEMDSRESVEDAVPRVLREGMGIGGLRGSGATSVPLPAVDHAFTHLKARYHPVLLQMGGHRPETLPPDGHRWVGLPAIREELPLPVAQLRILDSALAWLGHRSP